MFSFNLSFGEDFFCFKKCINAWKSDSWQLKDKENMEDVIKSCNLSLWASVESSWKCVVEHCYGVGLILLMHFFQLLTDTKHMRYFSDILSRVLFSYYFQMLINKGGWTSFTFFDLQKTHSLCRVSQTIVVLSDILWILHPMLCWYWRLFVKRYAKKQTNRAPPEKKPNKFFFYVWN